MKTKKMITTLVLATFLMGGVASSAFAGGHKSSSSKDCKKKSCCFMKEIYTVFLNQEHLNITEEQYASLKALKIATKKDMIQRSAAIDVIKVDIKSQLWEGPVDVETVNGLIDQKYTLKAEKKKATVKALAELRNTLTEEQRTKVKQLKIDKMKSGSCHGKCPTKK